MISVSLDNNSLQGLKQDFEEMKKIIIGQELQIKRAESYKTYTKNLVKGNQANLKPISSATKFLSGDHSPEFLTGRLLDEMKVKPSGNFNAEVGYFAEDSVKVPGKDLTYTQLANLQHTGYRIPLTGEKGRKVIAWMRKVGLLSGGKKSGGTKQWIYVPARPFMFTSFARFEEEGKDFEFVSKYLDEKLGV